MPTAPKAHYIITGENNACQPSTLDSTGVCTLLEIAEEALDTSQASGKYDIQNPRVFVFTDGQFVDVTDRAAKAAFDDWLLSADADDYPPEWLTDNCKAADDLHAARRAVDPEVAADEAYDMARVA